MMLTVKNYNLITFTLSLFFVLLSGTNSTFAQEPKKECDRIYECLQTFYSECYDDKTWDMLAPKLLDKFSITTSNHETEMGSLDKYFTELQNNPQAMGYIVVYGGKVNKYREYDIRVGRIKRYIAFRNQNQNRIKFVNGGFREEFAFELWISPIKNAFPPLSPTIAPEKVKFRGIMKPFKDYL